MISIERHPRGLLIVPVGGSFDKTLLTQLEGVVGVANMFATLRGYVVPMEAAFEVLSVCGEAGVTWDKDVLDHAHFQAMHRNLQSRAQVEVAAALAEPFTAIATYSRLSRLDPHQISAVAAMTVPSLRGLGLFDEQGSGKTIMVLAAYEYLQGRGTIERLITVAPKSVLGAWQSECNSFLDGRYRVTLVEGSASSRARNIMVPHDILLISYETLIRELRLVKTLVAANPNSYMLAVDESYFVKNAETARAKAVADVRPYCERAIVLCGTPAPNSAGDIVNQITIADGGLAFPKGLTTQDPRQVESEVAAALDQTIYLRRLKEDIFPDIVSKTIDRVFVDLAPIQKSLYERARDELIVAVRGINEEGFRRHLAGFMAQRIALLQICSNPGGIDQGYGEEPAKLRALTLLLNELVERQGKKVVIWSYFRHSLQTIVRRFHHLGVVHIDGTVVRIEERIEAIRHFQEDSDIHLFVGNAAAAGAGITLTAAHHAIYESLSNQGAHYMQSVDRIHRRGQLQDVTYHVLLARGTIEEAEFARLLDKERTGRKLLGDRYHEPMTRERFLSELEVTA